MFNAKNVAIGYVLAIAIIAVFTAALVSGALVSTKTISSTGVVTSANLGVYSDSACSQALTSIDWGTVSPGGSAIKTVYVKNIGTTQVSLSMTKTNWNPTTANGPVTITWNQEGAVLAVNQVSTATLTLNIASSVSGITTFSVDIVISGTG
jgi:hypothetical protein